MVNLRFEAKLDAAQIENAYEQANNSGLHMELTTTEVFSRIKLQDLIVKRVVCSLHVITLSSKCFGKGIKIGHIRCSG